MPETSRQQKITFGEIRESGIDRILIYCADFKCSHSIQMSADRWPDHVRLSDIEPLFVCKACGKRGADVRGSSRPPGWARADDAWQASARRRYSVEALTKLLDDLPEVVHVLHDDPQGFL